MCARASAGPYEAASLLGSEEGHRAPLPRGWEGCQQRQRSAFGPCHLKASRRALPGSRWLGGQRRLRGFSGPARKSQILGNEQHEFRYLPTSRLGHWLRPELRCFPCGPPLSSSSFYLSSWYFTPPLPFVHSFIHPSIYIIILSFGSYFLCP